MVKARAEIEYFLSCTSDDLCVLAISPFSHLRRHMFLVSICMQSVLTCEYIAGVKIPAMVNSQSHRCTFGGWSIHLMLGPSDAYQIVQLPLHIPQPPCRYVGSHDRAWPMSCGWEWRAPLPGQSIEEPEQFSSCSHTCPVTEEASCWDDGAIRLKPPRALLRAGKNLNAAPGLVGSTSQPGLL